MSYIRSTSNHEGLYVWGDGHLVNFHGGLKILDSERELTAPADVFHKAALAWDGDFEEGPVDVKGFEVVRVVAEYLGHNEHLIRVSFRGKKIYIFDVTWSYLVNNILQRENKLKRVVKHVPILEESDG